MLKERNKNKQGWMNWLGFPFQWLWRKFCGFLEILGILNSTNTMLPQVPQQQPQSLQPQVQSAAETTTANTTTEIAEPRDIESIADEIINNTDLLALMNKLAGYKRSLMLKENQENPIFLANINKVIAEIEGKILLKIRPLEDKIIALYEKNDPVISEGMKSCVRMQNKVIFFKMLIYLRTNKLLTEQRIHNLFLLLADGQQNTVDNIGRLLDSKNKIREQDLDDFLTKKPNLLPLYICNGFNLLETASDGNCMYASVEYQLKSSHNAQYFRDLLVQHVEQHKGIYIKSVGNMVKNEREAYRDIDDYLNCLRTDQWAQQFEVSLLMSILKRPIAIVDDITLRVSNEDEIKFMMRITKEKPIFIYYALTARHYLGIELMEGHEEKAFLNKLLVYNSEVKWQEYFTRYFIYNGTVDVNINIPKLPQHMRDKIRPIIIINDNGEIINRDDMELISEYAENKPIILQYDLVKKNYKILVLNEQGNKKGNAEIIRDLTDKAERLEWEEYLGRFSIASEIEQDNAILDTNGDVNKINQLIDEKNCAIIMVGQDSWTLTLDNEQYVEKINEKLQANINPPVFVFYDGHNYRQLTLRGGNNLAEVILEFQKKVQRHKKIKENYRLGKEKARKEPTSSTATTAAAFV